MDSGSAASVSDLVSCQVCWASVPQALVVFHRDWHARLEERLVRGLADDLRTDLATDLADLAAVPVVEPRRNARPRPAVLGACQSE